MKTHLAKIRRLHKVAVPISVAQADVPLDHTGIPETGKSKIHTVSLGIRLAVPFTSRSEFGKLLRRFISTVACNAARETVKDLPTSRSRRSM